MEQNGDRCEGLCFSKSQRQSVAHASFGCTHACLLALPLFSCRCSPTSTSGPSRPAFVSSVVPDTQLGLPPVRHTRVAQHPRREAKNKMDDVTWRHKKWLGEFAERRTAISQTMEERVAAQQEKAKRFAERAQATRDAIRGIKSNITDEREKAQAIEAALIAGGGGIARPKFLPTEYVDVSQQYPSGAPPPLPVATYQMTNEVYEVATPSAPATSRPSAATQSSSKKPSGGTKASAAKPGWARTAAEDDDFLDAEADSLLSFAAGLDYDRYMDDLEVREAIAFVKERVKNLEESKQSDQAEEEERQRLIVAGELEEVYVVDESKPLGEDGQPQLKKIVRRTKRAPRQAQTFADADGGEEWNASTAADGAQQSERDRQAQQDVLTKTVLESNRAMRNVHSSASVRAIVEKEGRKLGAGGTEPASSGATTLRRSQLSSVSEGGASSMLHPAAGQIRPPVITTIHEKEANHHHQKGVNPSNLPFLYRHPGI